MKALVLEFWPLLGTIQFKFDLVCQGTIYGTTVQIRHVGHGNDNELIPFKAMHIYLPTVQACLERDTQVNDDSA